MSQIAGILCPTLHSRTACYSVFGVASAYMRLRVTWGGIDITAAHSETPQYGLTEIKSGGASAADGSGVGVRRCTLIIDRKTEQPSSDSAAMHFDFLNVTGGTPDDTWTSADYDDLELKIATWCTAVADRVKVGNKFSEFRWHRVGTGVVLPNPAQRTSPFAAPISGTDSTSGAPQVASSITFRTGVRTSWGRTYLPIGGGYIAAGRLSTGAVDDIAAATHALVTAAAASDFHLVVVSKPLASALNVEQIEVDDVTDVIRRRRWKTTNYRKILP